MFQHVDAPDRLQRNTSQHPPSDAHAWSDRGAWECHFVGWPGRGDRGTFEGNTKTSPNKTNRNYRHHKVNWEKKHITPASDPKQCVGGQQQKILYVSLRQPPNTRRRDKSQENCLQDICLCLLYTSYLKILCRSHVSDSCRSVHQWGAATRSTSSDSCLNIFVSQAPLQDPCLWIHVSASMCISGSSARSMLPDS